MAPIAPPMTQDSRLDLANCRRGLDTAKDPNCCRIENLRKPKIAARPNASGDHCTQITVDPRSPGPAWRTGGSVIHSADALNFDCWG